MSWHGVGVGRPWHGWGVDEARRLRVECERRHDRRLLS